MQPSPRSILVLGWLGVISYPLYVLHVPLLVLVNWAVKLPSGQDVSHLKPWARLACLAGLLAVSWAADRWLDIPVRRWLLNASQRLGGQADRRTPDGLAGESKPD